MATTFLVPWNNAATTTAEVCLIGAATVAVTDGSVFPLTADGDFHASFDDEIVLVTANATNTFTITRAQEGTAAAEHASGVAIRLLITAEAITEIHTAVNNIENAYVDTTGTPADNQIAIFTDANTVEGDASLIFDGDDLTLAVNKGLVLGDGAEKIESDNTDLTINSGVDINLTATDDINIPVNVGLRFGDGGENIETDNTDLTITSGGEILLTSASDVVIPVNIGLHFGDGGEKIEEDNYV